MNDTELAIIILAAGKGTRMKSHLHKVLHPLGGRPMLHHLMDTLKPLKPSRTVLVVGADKEQLEASVGDQAHMVVQEPQLGTGHAVDVSRDYLKDFKGTVLILYGDVPLIRRKTMENMIDQCQNSNASVVVLGFRPKDALSYGRLKVINNKLKSIVEYKDANEEDRAISLCNSGIMAVCGTHLFELLSAMDDNNAAKEYYLTDIVEIANDKGLNCSVVETSEFEVMGINSRSELANAEAIFQNRARADFMDAGVSLIDPSSVYFSHDTIIGQDVTIGPNVFFGPGVEIADNVTINAFCHIEGARVGSGSSVGPFARLRPAAILGENVKVGNFVEIKKSDIHDGAKISHLSYIGDAQVGAGANIGAGTITCNYDGFFKYKTEIGAGAFIGSNTALVAPVKIGEGATVGAGSVVTSDASDDALVITRIKQREITGWSATFRRNQQIKKDKK